MIQRPDDLSVSEQTILTLSHEDFERFAQTVQNPPVPNEKLRELMRRKAPWETSS